MSSSKITLPGFLIADLFKHSLVELSTTSLDQQVLEETDRIETETVMPVSLKIKFMGGNSKNVIILVNQPDTEYIDRTALNFLTAVLKACSLVEADIAIVNIASQNLSYTDIKNQLSAMRIILFDVNPSAIKLPFNVPNFQPQHFAGVTFLTAPALSEINKTDSHGKLLKTGLWTSLKKIFDI